MTNEAFLLLSRLASARSFLPRAPKSRSSIPYRPIAQVRAEITAELGAMTGTAGGASGRLQRSEAPLPLIDEEVKGPWEPT